MTELEPWAGALGVVIAAILASVGTVLGSRWSHRNERTRLRNELVTILGHDRDSLADAAEKARSRANEVDAELERVRDERRQIADEYAAAKIVHREALAEKDQQMRDALQERDAQRRQLEVTLADVRAQMAELERELHRSRDEVTRRGDMINAQAQVIAQLRAQTAPANPGGTGT